MNEIFAAARPLSIRLILAFVAGDLTAQQLPVLPATSGIIGACLLTGGLICIRWRLAGCFLLGLVWAMIFATARLHDGLAPELEGKDLLVEGVVLGLPQRFDHGWRFDLKIATTLEPGEARLPSHVRLTWYQNQTPLKTTERWRLRIRLKRPHGLFNPGGMDYEQWLFAQGIRATGYVKASQENLRIAASSPAFSPPVWRQILYDRLTETLATSPFAGIVKALAMGADDDIPSDQWEVFRRTGTVHLVAISGSHISLIAGSCFFLVRRLCASLGILRWAPPQIAAVVAFLAALLYSALADFAIPTQRALIMIAVVMGGILGQRNVRPFQTLAIALLMVTVYDPLAVLAPGFWLSFAAVGLILLAICHRIHPIGWWASLWKINWVTTLGLAPLLLLFFQQISLIAPIANLLAVPAIGLLAIPFCLIGSALLLIHVPAGSFILAIAEHVLHGIWLVVEWLSALTWAQWTHAGPMLWTLPFALLGTLLLLMPKGIPARWLGLILLTPALSPRWESPDPGSLRLTLLDVGQGLAAAIRTQNHILVFDTGAKLSDRFDMGRAVVEPFLRDQGITRIDALVVSHGDNDHIGGARALVERFAVDLAYSTVPQRLPVRSTLLCQAGQSWEWDGVRFEMLAPFTDVGNENDNSCVLRASTAGGGVLMTGDIEKAAEQVLASRYGEGLSSKVLIVPHHGSSTSSSREFVAAVQPRYGLVAAGYLNRYGLPHASVVQRYREIGASVISTADAGAIIIEVNADGSMSQPQSYRLTHGRYWNSRPEPGPK